MPHITTWEDEGIYWKYYGDVTNEEIDQAGSEMFGDARFDDIRYFISDTTESTAFSVKKEDAVYPATQGNVASMHYKKSLKGAMVATNEHARNFLKHYIEKSTEWGSSWDLKLFYTMDEAREWLSLK